MNDLGVLNVYKGDGFSYPFQFPESMLPLSDYQITAMCRTRLGKKVCDFVVTPAPDQNVNPGIVVVKTPDSVVLPSGFLVMDFLLVNITVTPNFPQHTPKLTIFVDRVETYS